MILQGQRVRLRPFVERELDLIEGWLSRRELLIGDWQPYQPEMVTQVRSALSNHLESDDKGGWLAIELLVARQVIGQVRYTLRQLIPHYVEFYDIGYGIAALDQRHKGLARKACRLLIDHLFANHPIERVGAYVYTGNAPSIRLLERLGFSCEGTYRHATFFDGRWNDLAIYSLLRGEWERGKEQV